MTFPVSSRAETPPRQHRINQKEGVRAQRSTPGFTLFPVQLLKILELEEFALYLKMLTATVRGRDGP